MPYKYGKKADGSTGWGKEETINSKNLRGNASATENWLITTRGNDQIYYKTAGNGDRYYIDKNGSSGKTTTWNVEEAMTVAEWGTVAASPQLEENQKSSTLPSEPIGGDSLPPQQATLASPSGANTRTFQVTVEKHSDGTWHSTKTTLAAPQEEMLRRRKRATRRGRRGRSRHGRSRKLRR